MVGRCRTRAAGAGRGSGAALFFGFSSRFELSDQVHVDEADAATKAHLERVKALVSNQQWDEAVETLRQVMEDPSGKVIGVTERRFMRVRDYCHLQIASLPVDALKLYRGRVDPQADKWLEEGLATRNAELLERVVDQYFCASAGDDALAALGELALEEGDYGAARGWWEKIIETPPQAVSAEIFAKVRNAVELAQDETQLLDRWYQSDAASPPRDWLLRTDQTLDDKSARALVEFWKSRRLPLTRLAYPRSELPLAYVRARLVLVSILEGSPQRAKAELAGFAALYPEARGKLGGREVVYAEGASIAVGKFDRLAQAGRRGRLVDFCRYARAKRRGAADDRRSGPRLACANAVAQTAANRIGLSVAARGRDEE